jgi:beta-lactamase superfamily II metal-dependent hydrolase
MRLFAIARYHHCLSLPFLCAALLLTPAGRARADDLATVEVIARDAALRSGPAADAPLLGMLHAGDRASVTASWGWWLQVQAAGQPAWVPKQLVRLVSPTPSRTRLHIVHFDVGEGDATLIVSRAGLAMLIDTGSQTAAAAGIANYIVQSRAHLAHLVITHYDAAHMAAVNRVIAGPDGQPGFAGQDDDGNSVVDGRRDTGEYGTPDSDDLLPDMVWDRGDQDRPAGSFVDDYLAVTARRRVPYTDSLIGRTFNLGDPELSIQVLAANARVWQPDGTLASVPPASEDDRSLVVHVNFRGFDEVIGGDVTAPVEALLTPALRRTGIDLFHANDHGADTSNSAVLLQAMQPEVVLVSTGDSACGPGFNDLGHPGQNAIDRFSVIHPQAIYQTRRGGARPRAPGNCQPATGEAYPRNYRRIRSVFGGDTALDTDGEYYVIRPAALPAETRVFPVDDAIIANPDLAALSVHLQSLGWLPAFPNAALVGAADQTLRVEALQLRSTGGAAQLLYRGHVQDLGDRPWVNEGDTLGTIGQSHRLEGVAILAGNPSFGVAYRALLTGTGWTAWSFDGQFCGTRGQSRAILALNVILYQR